MTQFGSPLGGRFNLRGNPLKIFQLLVTLPRQLRLFVRLMGDHRVPIRAKLIVVGAIFYLISPLDLVPDFAVPILGQMDDLVVLWLAFRALVWMSPPEVVAEHAAPGGRP